MHLSAQKFFTGCGSEGVNASNWSMIALLVFSYLVCAGCVRDICVGMQLK